MPASFPTPTMFRALRHRNYRLFFGGQLISMTGTWLTRIAIGWLVYSISGSAIALGVVSFAGQLPTFLLAPFAGVMIDRLSRYHVLVVTQILAMVQSGLLAYLTLSDSVTIPHILALSVFQGIINAFDTPARQSMVVEMVQDKADLPNAIALNSSLVNFARLLGPSLAGILIATVGIGGCFAIDTISYVAVIGSLLLMKITIQKPSRPAATDIRADLLQGFQYTWRFHPIRALLLLLALISFMGMPYTVLLPVIASVKLGGGAHELGYLSGAAGLGALCGALYLASRKSVLGLGKLIPTASMIFGIGLIALGLSPTLPLSLLAAMVAGLGMMVQLAATNTLLQTIVDEDKRGRVMSYYTMAVFGMAPFGSLYAGWAGDTIGADYTLMIGGLSCIIGGLFFLKALPGLKTMVRPIYIRLGIVSPVPVIAQGIETATLTSEAQDGP